MSDQIQPDKKTGFMDLTLQAFAFDKVIIGGLLICFGMVLVFSFLAVYLKLADSKMVEFIITFWKDMGIFLAGGLVNSIRHNQQKQ